MKVTLFIHLFSISKTNKTKLLIMDIFNNHWEFQLKKVVLES